MRLPIVIHRLQAAAAPPTESPCLDLGEDGVAEAEGDRAQGGEDAKHLSGGGADDVVRDGLLALGAVVTCGQAGGRV